jgi:alkylation response protein AidB-like acyl-CoA dehydrogenase
MTVTDRPLRTGTDPIDDLRDWLAGNWDPDLTVAAWWERLGLAGWAAPLLPVGRYGRGLSRGDALRVARAIAEHGALGGPVGLGLGLAAPTIATHGTPEQVERYVRDIVTGQQGWCQLFSEPGAGSDLAGLQTRAVRDGDEWVVNGQKVWTSGGHLADLGMLLARTDPGVPKHQGITWFVLDMHQPGVEVRPLREMTGNTMFSEVFLTDATVADDARIGDANDGWAVANTTLVHERSGMGERAAGGGPRLGFGFARAGTVAGDLDRRAGDLVGPRRPGGRPSPAGAPGSAARASAPAPTAARVSAQIPTAAPASAQVPAAPAAAPLPGHRGRTSPAAPLVELARRFGRAGDPAVRRGLVQAHVLGELSRLNAERNKAVRAARGEIAGIANFSKLLMADILRHNRDLGLQILGARGMLHAYDGPGRESLADVPGGNAAALTTAQALQAQALPIFGGTDQIQRNILGERVLGLPKEPGDLSRVPFDQLPRNG